MDQLLRLQGTLQRLAGEPRLYQARFVRAGPVRGSDNSAAGVRLAPQALAEAVRRGLFDFRAVFVDHSPPGSSPSLLHLAGQTLQASWDAAEQAVIGPLRLYATESGRAAAELLQAVLDAGPDAPDVGLSMVFYPLWDGNTVTAIRHVESVDLVFQPAADGRILAPPAPAGLAAAPPDAILMQEGESVMTTQPVTETTPAAESPAAPNAPADAAAWQQAATQAAAQAAQAQIVAASGLPQAARERLAASGFAGPADLSAAIEAERSYLAALQQDGVVHIGAQAPRGGHISGMSTSLERIEAATEAMLMGTRPANGIAPLSGVRELYHLLSGDYELSGVFQPERVQFASVTCATMPNLVANVLNKVIVNEFQHYPRWWEPIVQQRDFASLQAIRWISLGGIGELPTVAEGAAYTELNWADTYETSTFIKKGGYLGISMEAIDKDDTGRLTAAPRALAQSAWLALSKAVAAIFSANGGVGPTLADSTALFHSSRANLGSEALSISAYNAARTAMRKFTELNSGERLGALTAPRYLLVPPDLEFTAQQVLASEYDYSYSLVEGQAAPINPLAAPGDLAARLQAARARVIPVDLWTDSDNWAAVADPNMYPTIGLGFRYGRQPEVFSAASPSTGLMFTNDTLPIKVRFFFAAGPMDWRGLYKANVA